MLSLTRLGLLPRLVWADLPIEKEFRVVLPEKHYFIYSSVNNDMIGRALYWRGIKGYEPETISVFYNLAKKSNFILDIGASTGLFSLVACAANDNLKAFSFEPVPRVQKLLQRNIDVNGWGNRCQVRKEAISNHTGKAKLHIPYADIPYTASLNPNGYQGWKGQLFETEVTTIDSLIPSKQGVDLIKIDVEGFEDRVLEGMQILLKDSKPAIILEVNKGDPFRRIEEILGKFHYKYYHLQKSGPIAVDRIVPDESEIWRNFLCITDNRQLSDITAVPINFRNKALWFSPF